MVEAFGGQDPRAVKLHAVPHRITAGEAAWEFLSGFNWYRKRIPGIPGVLRDLQTLRDAINDIEAECVADMRADGASWGEVGDALGISRQGARQRYGGRGIA